MWDGCDVEGEGGAENGEEGRNYLLLGRHDEADAVRLTRRALCRDEVIAG